MHSLQPTLSISHFILTLLAAAPTTTAWGTLGHMTVAAIASNFLTPATQTLAQTLLNTTSPDYLTIAAPWADHYRATPAGRFTAPFHFIDAEDAPPDACSTLYTRDCGGTGCLASAILNYTLRVQDVALDGADRADALRFLVHFLGDATQPLHNEAIARGGNDIAVAFGSELTTNLHAVWDTLMPEKRVGGGEIGDAVAWAANLTGEIVEGVYSEMARDWLVGSNLSDPVGSAMVWAGDANRFVCDYVLAGGVEAVQGRDLEREYYEGAVPVFELQIAKGGYRLAAWLNAITDATLAQAGELAKTMDLVDELR